MSWRTVALVVIAIVAVVGVVIGITYAFWAGDAEGPRIVTTG